MKLRHNWKKTELYLANERSYGRTQGTQITVEGGKMSIKTKGTYIFIFRSSSSNLNKHTQIKQFSSSVSNWKEKQPLQFNIQRKNLQLHFI